MSDQEWNELRRNNPKTSKLISDFENLAVENLESRQYVRALELIRESSSELSAMQARIKELELANKRKAFRLGWIYDNFGDTTAMRFSMEAEDSEIDEVMKESE